MGQTSYEERRELVSRRFPNSGYYNSVSPEPIAEAEVETGDAIDDLADIFGDLEDFDAHWQEAGPDAALSGLAASYEVHWGGHLRSLQLYLHARHGKTPAV